MSDLSSLTMSQLKKRLREKNLKVGGKKQDLIDRLMNCEEKSDDGSSDDNLSKSKKRNAYASESSSEEQEESPMMSASTTSSASPKSVKSKAGSRKRKRQRADLRAEDAELESKAESDTEIKTPPPKRRKKAATSGGDDHDFKIMCFNINGIRASAKKGLKDVIASEDADIVCFSEMKAKQTQNPIDFGDEYQLIWNECTAKAGYAGSAILTKREPLSIQRGIGVEDTEGRALTLEFEKFYIVNTYVPNSGQNLKFEDRRREWDAKMIEFLRELQDKKPVIWTGDLNVAILDFDVYDGETNANRKKTPGFTPYERENFRTLLKSLNMVDSYRHFYPKTKAESYTFFTQRSRGTDMKKTGKGWRLDYFVVSQPMMDLIDDVQIRKKVDCSDHVPLILTMKDPDTNL